MSKKIIKILITIVIIGTSIYFSFNMIMNSLIHSKKELEVPLLIGKSLYDSLDELSKIGFGLIKDGEEANQNVPSGIILRQNPQAGILVREGKIIKVTISQGGEIVYVPNLVGQTIRSADITLKRSTLVMGEVERKFSAVMEKDYVISQDIKAGQKVDKDSVVNIIVSEGLPPEGTILMPNFVNLNIEEAKIWASANDVNLDIKTENNEGIENNTIINQYPQPDTNISDARYVTLTISTNEINLQ
ncbi:MAG: PASTA domain-containing protein [Endomicrobium sp.]|uniref:PASTA domain-containing protein n=1 Tax=Candidatus Endomicrobiellum cubanum TaxID=3242325 RepID=UPI00282FC615|nr:PASTA domain-containing protein [Endomicrobium sp.]